jgi:hypothetical protein
MTSVLDIDFQVVFYMVVGLFGLAGFVRGWWKEAITTGLLVFLLIMLEFPDLAQTIIDTVNNLLGRVRDVELVQSAGVVPPTEVDPNQSQVYIITLVVLVVVSYFIGNSGIGNFNITTGGRIFGGILGFTNGFIILSLVREYILRRFLTPGAFAAASAPEQLTVNITNVPRSSITDGFAIWVFIIAGALLVMFALFSRISYTSGKLSARPPLGYK